MAISLASLKQNNAARPPRILLYGTSGIGKTTFAASAPAPVFIQFEDGLGEINVPTFGLLNTHDQLMEAIGSLYSEAHGFQTVVLDSLDWLEPAVWKKVAADNTWKDIETPGYGRGYVAADAYWRNIMDGFDALRNERGMTVIFIAHHIVKNITPPDTDPYSRYQIKLHERASGIIREHSDAVLFANYEVRTVKTDVGLNKKITRGVAGTERFIYAVERPAYLAKNRYGISDPLPIEWSAFASYIPFFNQSVAIAAE